MTQFPFYKSNIPAASRLSVLLAAVLLPCAWLLGAGAPACCQEEPGSEERPELRITIGSRSFIPEPGIDPEFHKRLARRLRRGEKPHVLLQLHRHLNPGERTALEAGGVELLSYVGGYGWYATVTRRAALDFTDARELRSSPELGWIRSIGEIQPTDRLAPELSPDRLAPEEQTLSAEAWIRTDDDRECYWVYFFRDVSPQDAGELIRGLGGEIREEESLNHRFSVLLPPGAREKLLEDDRVKVLDRCPPPEIPHNDGSRAWCRTDTVHADGIDGTGVVLGIWEAGGLPLGQHVDLTHGRIRWQEAGSASPHATHVCGTMIGAGTGEAMREGHASGVAEVHCYTTGGAPGEMATAMTDHGIVAANNSWGVVTGWNQNGNGWKFGSQGWFGDYRWRCADFDELVRDKRLVVVFSAGNDRDDPRDGSETDARPGDWDQIVGAGSWQGYHTVVPDAAAKNVITVGAIDDMDGGMADFSNWGPTDDGRIKPDLVAPGVDILSCSTTAADPDNDAYDGYYKSSGTSMAAPAVSGVVALLVQSYRKDYLGDPDSEQRPLASTIKALLCHSAADMGDPGPDYRYGWGGVRSDAARRLILDKRFREGVVLTTGDLDVYDLEVGTGDTELRITLAWDDAPATGINPNPTLINDLDLVVEDPGGRFYTPWHLHVTSHRDVGETASREVHEVAGLAAIPEDHRDRWNNVEQVFVDAALAGGLLESGTWKIYVEAHALPEAPQRYSLISELPLRGRVDVVQVLDRSGSMGQPNSPSSVDPKIEVLKDAAAQFIDIMEPGAGNRLGVVQFHRDVEAFPPPWDAGLRELTPAHAAKLKGAVATIEPGGLTSIGEGLAEARDQLVGKGGGDRDRVVLLVTDGHENEPRWIAEVEDDLKAERIAVYALGLGYGSGLDEAKLAALTEATGGRLRITDDDLEFRKFFIEVLAGAVDWSLVVDPAAELRRGEIATQKVTVTGDETGATFTAYWQGIDEALALQLIPPGRTTPIDLSALGDRVRAGSADHYAFIQLDFPVPGCWIGEWTMVIRGTDKLGEQTVRYGVSAFTRGGLTLDVDFDQLHQTGDEVLMTARLSRDGRPVPGAVIRALCDVPTVGAGNVLHRYDLDPDALPAAGTAADPLSPVERKLLLLNRQFGRNVLSRGTAELRLHDDGRHHDRRADDGTYANVFDQTRIAGSYTCRFVASGIPVSGGATTTREWSGSFHNEVAISPGHSIVEARLLARTDDGWRYRLEVVPRDRFGNYLGPGHRAEVVVPGGAGGRVELNDDVDGVYVGTITLPSPDTRLGTRVRVTVGGDDFTIVEPPGLSRWWMSWRGGVATTRGTLRQAFHSDRSLSFDLGYSFSPRLSLVGQFGYHRVRSATPDRDDGSWAHASANLKVNLWTGRVKPFLRGGLGLYDSNQGDGSGGNLGLGVDLRLSGQVSLTTSVDFHSLFNEDVDFAVRQMGVTMRF